ncbi:hypothetical protein Ahy_A02g005811 [Arachis hypogaea]|uniref:Aminotransferase-like plant mobile domain-containing protein n=1 Tax=Arachis hypogaea TaxID=3818 RepID=A0A445E7S5_ARAHY|nr:hypothetical protein Ahy_A02g005811 [Arachis hypogaea]
MEQQLLGYEDTLYILDRTEHIAGRFDRVIRWTVKLTWFHNTVCGELEQDATVERLLRYTRRYIMKLIGGILFPDASDSRVHIRWLPLLEDLEMCGGLSWGLTVLAWLYCQMCCATEHRQCNLGGCINLLLSWAYHHIPLLRPDGFDTCRFLLVERWVHYLPDNAKGEGRLRNYISTLNGIGMLNTPYADLQLIGLVPLMIAEAEASAAVVCPLLCFAIVEWHQVDRVVHQFGSLQHILTKPLNIDKMHKLNGWFGRDEWFLQLLGGWHELWNARADHRLHIHHHIDLRPSLPYMAHTELFGQDDQHLVAAGSDDGHLSELRPVVVGGRGRGRGRARGRGRRGAGRGRQDGGIFRSTIVLLIVRLTVPLNGLSSTVSADDPRPPN